MLQQRDRFQGPPITDFDSHENKKLTEHEILLIEYAFFSLCEEVDIFYCSEKEGEVAQDIEFTEAALQSRLMSVLEALESHPYESEQWKARLRQLYLLSMGVYRSEGEKRSPKKRQPEEEKQPEEPQGETGSPTESTITAKPESEENKAATEESKDSTEETKKEEPTEANEKPEKPKAEPALTEEERKELSKQN